MDGLSEEESVALAKLNGKNDARNGSPLCCSNKTSKTSTSSSRTCVTQCRVESSSKITDNVDLRDEMIKALAWASCRAFKYKPSDPIHYLTHQLLRWRYGDITEYAPRMVVNFTQKYGSAGRDEISSTSFCSDECEYTCIGR